MEAKQKSKTKDMTVGNPLALIIGFVIPVFCGSLFQQFYSVVDTLIVGRVLGQEALAAVGCTGSVNFLVIGFCMGICSGFAIPIAQKFGAGDYANMRRFVANCLWATIAFAVVITVLVSLNTYNILHIMNTPDNIIDMARDYIFIIFIGIPATMLYNMLSGMLRALGDSKTPLYFLIFASAMNIFLDILCMVTFGMGVKGAAYATVFSQALSGIICLIYMIKKYEILRIKKGEWGLDFHIVGVLCGMGIPMGLQYSITALGAVVLQTSVNSLGSEVVAASTAASKVSMFFACGFDSLGATMATYGGQNVGAKKLDRISIGLRDCLIVGVAYSIIAFVVLYFWAGQLTAFFVSNPTQKMIEYSRIFVLFMSSAYILLAGVNIIRFLIQGLGFSTFAILAGVAEMIARALAGIVLVPIFGVYGAAIASPLAWLFADMFLVPAYFIVMKKLRNLFGQEK